jgi:hypothetical protein
MSSKEYAKEYYLKNKEKILGRQKQNYENLINLTSNQHRNKAHPKSNFNHVDPGYQKICLLSKCDAVNESEIRKDSFYSKSKLIEVMNVGFSIGIDYVNEKLSIKFAMVSRRIHRLTKR